MSLPKKCYYAACKMYSSVSPYLQLAVSHQHELVVEDAQFSCIPLSSALHHSNSCMTFQGTLQQKNADLHHLRIAQTLKDSHRVVTLFQSEAQPDLTTAPARHAKASPLAQSDSHHHSRQSHLQAPSTSTAPHTLSASLPIYPQFSPP